MRTALTDLLGLDVPIVQASPGPWTSVALTAAACEAGALGSVGTSLVAPARLRDMLGAAHAAHGLHRERPARRGCRRAVRAGRAAELVPIAGQTVGLIDAIVSVREVVDEMVDGAGAALAAVSAATSRG
jgi:NAD(P)H-dependent flavin oxidoreductase YrpB (nitropropane dioxygenase family)